MNKDGLKRLVSERNNVSLVEAEKSINMFIDGITEALKQDGKVQIQGFETWEIKDTKARTGVLKNANGEEIEWEKESGKKVASKISKAFQKEIVGE